MKAVHLSLLTRAGQPGSPTVLTMPRWGFYTTLFGNGEFELPKKYGSWCMENIFFKVMPVEGHGVSSVEAALIHVKEIQARGFCPGRDITKVEIRTNAAADMIINKKGKLRNAADRNHCMQYQVALAFLKGSIPEAADFHDNSPWATSPTLATLKDIIDIQPDEQLTADYMDLDKKSLAAGMTVHLRDGSILEEILIDFPIGHGRRAETAARVQEKFQRNMSLMFSEAEIAAVHNAVMERGDMKISEFTDLFVRENQLEVKL
jgi:2-methylcitrate dehydratase